MIEFGKTRADMSPGRWLDHIQAIWPYIASGKIREYEIQDILSGEELKSVGQYRYPMLEMAYANAQGRVETEKLGRYTVYLQAQSSDNPLGCIQAFCKSNGWSWFIAGKTRTKHPLANYMGEDVIILSEYHLKGLPEAELCAILSDMQNYKIEASKITRTLGFCKTIFMISSVPLSALPTDIAQKFICIVQIANHSKSKTGKVISFAEWDKEAHQYALLKTYPYKV